MRDNSQWSKIRSPSSLISPKKKGNKRETKWCKSHSIVLTICNMKRCVQLRFGFQGHLKWKQPVLHIFWDNEGSLSITTECMRPDPLMFPQCWSNRQWYTAYLMDPFFFFWNTEMVIIVIVATIQREKWIHIQNIFLKKRNEFTTDRKKTFLDYWLQLGTKVPAHATAVVCTLFSRKCQWHCQCHSLHAVLCLADGRGALSRCFI